MPQISVCIPTYNRAHILPYAVNSVLNQTHRDFELIICDDASPDNTAEVVAQWDDPRIHYIRHPQNIQRSRNMRSGYEAAQGKYFIKFDDDDALTPTFLERTVGVMEAQPEVDFVCTDHWVINARNERDEAATAANSAKWGKDRLPASVIHDLLKETFVRQSLQVGSTLFRTGCLSDVDFMRFEADGCEDFDLLVRLAIAGKTGYFIPERLMEYRFHGGQTSLKQDIHFLSAKIFCLESYRFSERPELETIRHAKLAGLKQVLAMRLIEKGDAQRGRQLIQELAARGPLSSKAKLGQVLSYLPLGLRQLAFQGFRQLRAEDYSERVRNAAG
ncbi:glycosyltransferase family 2 protein [Leptolyngbya cf. ectocarpi LEGE 11479]|uniref:Glycosyltransferase family 2 protein n=1 Tax=Leptolyngbya cf. ectocarpi LEGE 11479 TaxID=1828722 RepID=A0A928ZQT9_LEPEC|nr:glycosyltransferase [Leptolyngbya ectocarpi]MBE9065788.1 glycosyltransferase family 2 protein [Leptolyngbya cf. ectocarpi LEGE 11479]